MLIYRLLTTLYQANALFIITIFILVLHQLLCSFLVLKSNLNFHKILSFKAYFYENEEKNCVVGECQIVV